MTDKNDDGRSADENFLIAERRAKLARLREVGNAFPNGFRRDALASGLHATFGGHDGASLDALVQPVRVGGRLMAKRVMGKATFLTLADRSGRIQLFARRDELPDGVYQDMKGWDLGDIIGAGGTLMRTRTGELTVRCNELHLLTKALRPLPEKFHGLADQEMRYRMRYVDLIVNDRSREVFQARTRIVRYVRDYLDAMRFQEVETPMMQPLPGGAVARPFVTHHNALDMKLHLRIAPELYLKRLIVGGLERVYEINRCFRNEGLSTRHNPEFTMLELYQAYADYRDVMDLTETLVRGMAQMLHDRPVIVYQGRSYDLGAPFCRWTLTESVMRENPGLDEQRLRDVDYLRGVCDDLGIPNEPGHGAGKLVTGIFEKTVEPKLDQPTFIIGYPAEVSPLARRNDDDPLITDRFELFIAGREIANGFSELNDPEDQAARFREQGSARAGGDEEAMVYDADYIRALEYGMPPTAGLGVGIDRLTMLLTDSPSIRDVLLFPLMRPEGG